MRPHEVRVMAEKDELDSRIAKLRAFIAGPTFGDLHPAEQRRLRFQARFMEIYGGILGERIAEFPKGSP